MEIWQIGIIIAITLVVIEFGVHVVYHAVTGKAGVNDDAFSYLGDIYHSAASKEEKKKVEVTVIRRCA